MSTHLLESHRILGVLCCIASLATGLKPDPVFAVENQGAPDQSFMRLGPREIVEEIVARSGRIQSIDMMVTLTLSLPRPGAPGADRNLRPSRYRILKDATRWARKYSRTDPDGVCAYDICLPDGCFSLGRNDHPLAQHVHALNINEPREAESALGFFGHVLNLGSFWHAKTRDYALANAGRSQLAGWDEVDGINCAVVEITVPPKDIFNAFNGVRSEDMSRDGGLLRIYTAPQLGFCMPRYQGCRTDGTPEFEFRCSGFRDFGNGMCFPSSGRIIHFPLRGADGPEVERHSFQVEVASINAPIDDTEFTIVVPAGTSVVDERPGRRSKVVAMERTLFPNEPSLDKWLERQITKYPKLVPLEPSVRDPWAWLRRCLVIGNAAVLIAAAAVVGMLKLRRRDRHGP